MKVKRNEPNENHEEARLKTRIMSGNEALALGALQAGVKVVAGYPGTPSSGVIDSLMNMHIDNRHIEWSTNEKVAFEISAGASWAGQRALCTMKMSGLNVAYDSVISIAYSGVNGGLVIYVADDPGVSAGMAEQDSRGFALMSDLPMLEPGSVIEAYELTQTAFVISEKVQTPVFIRMVASVANSHGPIPVEDIVPPGEKAVLPERDIARYTKAGPDICIAQHKDLINRLEIAGRMIREMDLNSLRLPTFTGGRDDSSVSSKVGIIAAGVVRSYLDEAFEIADQFGLDRDKVAILSLKVTNPFPTSEVRELLKHFNRILVLEELEPYLEQRVYIEAQRTGFRGRIFGKIDGLFSRVGEYALRHVLLGLQSAANLEIPDDLINGNESTSDLAVARPITVCVGCPHRGTYMAINQAIKKSEYKKNEVMVTGDIGCTILGMNPPFNTLWNEISMGASIGVAQGFAHGGIETPIIATMGDSTFFLGGIPGLINAIQHQVPLTLIIMDNGWTGMTGMQVNPGTKKAFQSQGNHRIDIAKIIPGLGVEHFFHMDPFDLKNSVKIIKRCLGLQGVKVVLARRECTIQARRRGLRAGDVRIDPENCQLCKRCMVLTGCPAISFGEESVHIDDAQCYGCGLCAEVCKEQALSKEINNEI